MARRFVNWAGNVRSRPAAWHAPSQEDELCELVRGAAGRTVRAVGAGHSWSPIAAPEQLAVTLDRFAGVVRCDAAQVTVRGGTRLGDLNAALAAEARALPIVGSIAAQSVAGMIATATHGSSLVHGNLSSLVQRIRLIDGRGEPHELAGDDPRLDGARVHLGALGIVTEMTLAIGPAFQLAETVEPMPIGDVPAALAEIARSAEYVKVWWMPHTPHAAVLRYARTDEPTSTRPDPARQRRRDDRLHTWLFPTLLRLTGIRPLVAPVSRAVARSFLQPRRVGPSTLMLSTPMPARHREAEAAVPLDRAGEALDRIVRAIDRDRLVVNFLLEVRFVRGDRGWMSPAYGADTCQIGAYCHGSYSDRYFAAFWREMRALGARPHWGKEHDHTADEVRAAWPLAGKFAALRDQLDPDRVFASAYLTRVLGR
ncbi:MAG TPA: D-arabinono-1,4-lactone oxidase [Kofleriaceae bacterium]|nr:D-arabinono-1,4-lactone oxidase [Kofleriaceae bacterium]